MLKNALQDADPRGSRDEIEGDLRQLFKGLARSNARGQRGQAWSDQHGGLQMRQPTLERLEPGTNQVRLTSPDPEQFIHLIDIEGELRGVACVALESKGQ